jgi:tetratricopeptide (TPR) repeat protein
MFPRQNLAALIHALTVAAMPFSTVIGLVLFGMLTAPPSQQKAPETVSEMFSAAESKALRGKYEEALDLYNQIITKSPKSWALASAYWGRGATYFKQFTRVNTKVRSLRIKTRSDKSLSDEYQTTQQAAQTLFNRGMSDHLKAAEIADSLGLTQCSSEIRAMLPQLERGMVRYNNPYSLYLKRTLPRC